MQNIIRLTKISWKPDVIPRPKGNFRKNDPEQFLLNEMKGNVWGEVKIN